MYTVYSREESLRGISLGMRSCGRCLGETISFRHENTACRARCTLSGRERPTPRRLDARGRWALLFLDNDGNAHSSRRSSIDLRFVLDELGV